MMRQVVRQDQLAVGIDEIVRLAVGDDQDATAAAAMCRLDHEFRMVAEQFAKVRRLAVELDQRDQCGHREAPLLQPLLAQDLVIHQGIEPPRVVLEGVFAVPAIQAEHPRAPHCRQVAEHHCGSAGLASRRKRASSDRRKPV
jgi:hypothetical protein